MAIIFWTRHGHQIFPELVFIHRGVRIYVVLYYFDLRFTCSQVNLTCDKPISCSQMTLNGKFYIKLGMRESQNRFAD
jgi:hypothetical protein